MKKLRIMECFGGIGACSKALERLGIDYEIADYVEIDKYAVKSFNAIHNTNFEPQDICKWDKDIEVDLIMHGSPCVTADSLILTKDGYKPIFDVQVGDEVLTKSNVWHKVAKKFNNGLHQTCYLDGMGFENIHCTLNHKFYVREMYRKGHKNIRCFKEPVFKEAKDLTKKDYFGVPVIQEEKTFYTDECDFWYMLGMYLGDGWLSKTTNDTIIACNDIKLKKLKSHLDKEKWKYTYYKEKTCYKFRFSNKNVYQFIKKYIGTGSDNKHIPYEILCLPKKQLQSFYDGYLDSDGCVVENYHQFSSINRGMLYSVSLIINKLYNRPTCFYKIKVAKTKIIEGREVNQKEWYQLRFKPTTNKQDKAFYEDGYIWYPFNKLTIAKKENVYNMEVEEDHSYIIQGCISKNCQDFSLAGKQAGGDKDSGTRSSLMYETIRIVEKLKPKYVIWENVKNLLSKKHRHNFDAYLETMEQLGYTNYYQVLNAKDYGIPQNRERVFTISIRDDSCYLGDYDAFVDEQALNFKFPPKQELKLKLKDMLEDEVDEKYYLSDKQLNYVLDMKDVALKSGRNINDRIVNPQIAKTISCRGAVDQRADVTNFMIDECDEELKVKDIKEMSLLIKNATKKGYLSAYDGDGVNISSRMKYQRGNVQKEIIQTLTTSGGNDRGVVVSDKPRKDIKELEKYCEYCGKQLERKRFNGRLEDFTVFKNRKYCNRECMRKDWVKIGDNHNQSYSNAHTTARKINELILHKEVCELCGSDTNLDIHHIDGNWQNNNLDNLMCLCRSCHTRYERNKDKAELRIRKLTPREVWRLMGFDDADFEKAAKVNSNSQLYKQAGNSIVVNVLEAILNNLLNQK